MGVERFIPATTTVHTKVPFLGLTFNIFFYFLFDNGIWIWIGNENNLGTKIKKMCFNDIKIVT